MTLAVMTLALMGGAVGWRMGGTTVAPGADPLSHRTRLWTH